MKIREMSRKTSLLCLSTVTMGRSQMLTGREGKSHYYQSAEDEDQREEEEDQSSLPIYSDYGVESDANRERG